MRSRHADVVAADRVRDATVAGVGAGSAELLATHGRRVCPTPAHCAVRFGRPRATIRNAGTDRLEASTGRPRRRRDTPPTLACTATTGRPVGLLALALALLIALLAGRTLLLRFGRVRLSKAKQAECAAECRSQGSTAGPQQAKRTGKAVKVDSGHSVVLQNRLRAAVEARHPGGAESPSSIQVLLAQETSIATTRHDACPCEVRDQTMRRSGDHSHGELLPHLPSVPELRAHEARRRPRTETTGAR